MMTDVWFWAVVVAVPLFGASGFVLAWWLIDRWLGAARDRAYIQAMGRVDCQQGCDDDAD